MRFAFLIVIALCLAASQSQMISGGFTRLSLSFPPPETFDVIAQVASLATPLCPLPANGYLQRINQIETQVTASKNFRFSYNASNQKNYVVLATQSFNSNGSYSVSVSSCTLQQ